MDYILHWWVPLCTFSMAIAAIDCFGLSLWNLSSVSEILQPLCVLTGMTQKLFQCLLLVCDSWQQWLRWATGEIHLSLPPPLSFTLRYVQAIQTMGEVNWAIPWWRAVLGLSAAASQRGQKRHAGILITFYLDAIWRSVNLRTKTTSPLLLCSDTTVTMRVSEDMTSFCQIAVALECNIGFSKCVIQIGRIMGKK